MLLKDVIELYKAIPVLLFFLLLVPVISKAASLDKIQNGVVWIGLCLRGVVALLLLKYPMEAYTTDPLKYNRIAVDFAAGIFTAPEVLNVKVHSMCGAILYTVFGNSPPVWAIFNSLLGALTIVVVIKIIEQLFERNETTIGAVLYAFYPSYVLFSGSLQRETPVILLFALGILSFVKYLKTSRSKFFLSFLFFVMVGGLLRPLNIPLMLGIAGPFVFLKIYNSDTLRRYVFLKPFFAFFSFFLVVCVALCILFTPLGDLIRSKLAEEALVNLAIARDNGESAYLSWIQYSSIQTVILYMPIKFFYFTFGPFPWDFRGVSGLMAMVEGWLNLAMMVLSIPGILYLYKKNKYVALFLPAVALACLGAQGAFESNYGTALRHRISFTFVFVVLATYSLVPLAGNLGKVLKTFSLRRGVSATAAVFLAVCALLLFPAKTMAERVVDLPFEDSRISIVGAGSLAKYGRSYSGGEDRGQAGKIRLSAARNEYESFQIVIGNKGSGELEFKDGVLSDFRSEGGGLIARDNMEMYYVGYVNSVFPDVLFPANVQKYRDEFRAIRARENLILWFTVYIPPETRAGEYKSDLKIGIGGQVYTILLGLKVWDFALPRSTHVKSHLFNIHEEDIAARYNVSLLSEKYESIVEGIFEQFRKHRISPAHPTPTGLESFYRAKGSPEALGKYFEKWCARWIEDGFECNNILMRREKDIGSYRYLYEAIKRNGWSDKVFVKLPFDEAREGVRPERARENLVWARKFREAMPGVKTLHTLGGGRRDLTKRDIDYYSGAVDIWAFVPYSYLEDPAFRKAMDARIAKGEEMSWYIHWSLGVADPAQDLRYFFWEMWNNKVSRVNLWKVTHWSRPEKQRKVLGVKFRKIPEKKTTREKRGFLSTRSSGVGPGTLFWPDDDRVLTSVRLETIRDGIEDYEYFLLAKAGNIPIESGPGARNKLISVRNHLGEQIEKKSK